MMMIQKLLFLLTLSFLPNGAFGFVVTSPLRQQQVHTTTTTTTTITTRRWLGSSPSDYSDSNDDNDDDDDDDDNTWQIALQQRQLSFQQRQEEIRQRWLFADCQQGGIPIGDENWVRRVSVQWPLAACGTATGDVYLVQCETGQLLGKGQNTGEDQRRYLDVPLDPKMTTTLRQLFGDFDGGGTLAIGLSWNNMIAHAGRNGGVELWGIESNSNNKEWSLISKGTLLPATVVTSLDWAQDDLWIGTQDGRVLVYTIDDDDLEDGRSDDDDGVLQLTPEEEWKNLGDDATILSLSFHEELNVAVVTTSTGFVEILSMDEPEGRRTFYPPFDSGRGMRSNVFALCATIVREQAAPTVSSSSSNKTKGNITINNIDPKRQFALVCGGNDGSVYLQSLKLVGDSIPELDLNKPFPSDIPVRTLTPHHRGPCKCLASPFPGILLSGGQDGTVRVWDLNAEDEKSAGLYLLSGFKVWLGSLWTDGEHLVMDGSDNAISIFNFGERIYEDDDNDDSTQESR